MEVEGRVGEQNKRLIGRMVSAQKHRVLLIGSGLMTPPLVDYLTKFNDTHITVASNLIEDARKVASRHPQHMDAIFLDVFDVSTLFPSYIYLYCSGGPICVGVN